MHASASTVCACRPFRVLVNTPSPQGSTGITTNVFPAMTLGCGAVAGNSTSDNIGPLHLINIKRLAYVARKAEEAFENPEPSKRDRGASIARPWWRPLSATLQNGEWSRRPPVISSVVDRFSCFETRSERAKL